MPTGPSAAETARRVRRERALRLARALLVWVGIPTLLGVAYYGLISNEYESVTTLVMTGSQDDSERYAMMLREHLLSRDVLRALEERTSLIEHYTASGDRFSSLAKGAGSEARFDFYTRHVDARYEPHSRVFTLRVRAFSGAQAKHLSSEMLALGSEFVRTAAGISGVPYVVVASPSAPDQATHPKRLYGMATVFLASLALFGIGSLLVAAVREHAQF